MSVKIYGDMTEHFRRKMRNWAMANAGVTPMSYLISSCYRPGVRDTYGDSSREPILIGEAEDVNAAMHHIPLRYRLAVTLFWQYEGRPLVWFARRCGEGVDWRTFESRVIRGHELLMAELARQADKVSRYRESAMRAHAT